MAKDAKAAAEGGDQAPKKSKKLLIIILGVVLLLVLGGGAAVFLLKKGDDHGEDEEDAAETTHVKKKEKKAKEAVHPVFVNLEPFTVNLLPESGDQYLQVSLSIEFEEPTAEHEVKAQMPKIRNNITLLLSGKKPSELLTKEGKEKLADELRDAVNDVLEPPKRNKKGEVVRSEEGPAKDVLFTSFIIQ